MRKLHDLFWTKVDKKGPQECWEWLGNRDVEGYGRLGIDGKTHKAHRLSWVLKNGPIPEGMCICHHCDNPPCVNPVHLFMETVGDNNRDAARKGRSKGKVSRGEEHVRAKLTMENVREIRWLYAAGGVAQRELGIKFGVGPGQISRIVNRKNWTWLEG